MKYGAIDTWESDNEIRCIDSEHHGDECIKHYYNIIFEAKDIDDFNLQKYTYNGNQTVLVRNILFKINRRISKHRYLCENISEKEVGHIPFFSARRYGLLYMFYYFDFD